MAQRLVWSFFVVFFKPQFCLFAHFRQALKDKHIKHRFTVAAIESFDEAILHWSSWLDELEQHIMFFSPIGERHRYQFWAVVPAKVRLSCSAVLAYGDSAQEHLTKEQPSM